MVTRWLRRPGGSGLKIAKPVGAMPRREGCESEPCCGDGCDLRDANEDLYVRVIRGINERALNSSSRTQLDEEACYTEADLVTRLNQIIAAAPWGSAACGGAGTLTDFITFTAVAALAGGSTMAAIETKLETMVSQALSTTLSWRRRTGTLSTWPATSSNQSATFAFPSIFHTLDNAGTVVDAGVGTATSVFATGAVSGAVYATPNLTDFQFFHSKQRNLGGTENPAGSCGIGTTPTGTVICADGLFSVDTSQDSVFFPSIAAYLPLPAGCFSRADHWEVSLAVFGEFTFAYP